MDPARVVAGLVLLGLALVTLVFPERVLRYVEGEAGGRRVARVGALVTASVGAALVVGL